MLLHYVLICYAAFYCVIEYITLGPGAAPRDFEAEQNMVMSKAHDTAYDNSNK